MSRSQLFRDVNDPRLGDLAGSAIVSDPVSAIADQPVAERGEYISRQEAEAQLAEVLREMDAAHAPDEHEVDLVVDPITTMASDHIRIKHPNRTRSHR